MSTKSINSEQHCHVQTLGRGRMRCTEDECLTSGEVGELVSAPPQGTYSPPHIAQQKAERLPFFQFFHRHGPFSSALVVVHCSRPFFHPKRFSSWTQLSTVLRCAWRFAGSPSVFCSLWLLFGETFQMRKELRPWRCLF